MFLKVPLAQDMQREWSFRTGSFAMGITRQAVSEHEDLQHHGGFYSAETTLNLFLTFFA